MITTTTASSDCTIIVQDELSVYHHELAHCNGWNHAFGDNKAWPPVQFLHRYNDGLLTVIVTPGGYLDGVVARFAQQGAQVSYSHQSSDALCRSYWTSMGLTVKTKERQVVLGCTIREAKP